MILLPFINNSTIEKGNFFTVQSYSQNLCQEFEGGGGGMVTLVQCLYIKAREIIAQFSNSPTFTVDSIFVLSHSDVLYGMYWLYYEFYWAITILSKIYAPNLIEKLLDGHNYSCSMRSYVLLSTDLVDHLFKNMQVSVFCLPHEELSFMTSSLDYCITFNR